MSNPKLAAKRIQAGLPTSKRFKPIATLELSDDVVKLENQMDSVYELIKSLEPVVALKHLWLKPMPFTDKEMDEFIKDIHGGGIAKKWKAGNKDSRLSHGNSKKPSQINKDAWIEDRLNYIQKYSKD